MRPEQVSPVTSITTWSAIGKIAGKMSVRAPLNAVAKVLRAIWLPGLGVVWKTGIWSAAGPDWRVRRSRWFAL